MLYSWKITFRMLNHEEIDITTNYQNSMANTVNMIVSYLLDRSIPHNIIISDGGKTFYIIPRNFNEGKSNLEFNTNWLDLAGLLSVKSQEFFDNAETRMNEFFNFVRNSLSLNEASFNEITENILNNFEKIYKVSKLNL